MKTFKIDDVMIIIFETTLQLSLALSRVHEAYEGGKLKGPLKGVNFPMEFLETWMSNHTNDLCTQEKQVFELLGDCKYIIATLKGDQSSLYHEWAHAHYYLNPKFQTLVKDMFDGLPAQIKKVISYDLKMRGYSSHVLLDEFQAYIIENPNEFGKKWYSTLIPIHHKLRSIIQRPILNF